MILHMLVNFADQKFCFKIINKFTYFMLPKIDKKKLITKKLYYILLLKKSRGNS